ncbi:MAG TPA: hypothetical protein VID27_20655 [Blastocatellia bacterium]|jgi:hypothetical protein
MKRLNLHLKIVICLFAAATVFLLAPVKITEAGSRAAQDLKGTLSISGHATINNNVAQTGATVSSGSVIETGPDGDVTIDLGALGRIQMRPNTKIELRLAPGACQALMDRCGSITQQVPSGVTGNIRVADVKYVQVAVTDGKVAINREIKNRDGDIKMERASLRARSDKRYYHVREVNAEGGSLFTVQCCQCCFVEKTLPRP